MKMTLFKRASDTSPWVKVGTKDAELVQPATWRAQFAKVRGDKQCKMRARFTHRNHDPAVSKAPFSC